MKKLYRLKTYSNRAKLEDIHRRLAAVEIRSVPGMKLVEPRDYVEDSSAPRMECWWYLFENSNARQIGINDINNRLKEEVWMRPYTEPRTDLIAAYLGNDVAEYKGVAHRIILRTLINP